MIRLAQICPQPHVRRTAACLFPEMQADLTRRLAAIPRGLRNHTVPYGTDPILDEFQAINCLATIIRSLRDKSNQPLVWKVGSKRSRLTPTIPHATPPHRHTPPLHHSTTPIRRLAHTPSRHSRFHTREIQFRVLGDRIWGQGLLLKIETTQHIICSPIAVGQRRKLKACFDQL
jgi:hypothetical protein